MRPFLATLLVLTCSSPKSAIEAGPDAIEDTADDGDIDDVNSPDQDGDGSPTHEDCNDSDPTVYPGARELCDGLDNDCDGNVDNGIMATFYRDADEDGYGDPDVTQDACERPEGFQPTAGDCLDTDAEINPDAEEVCDGRDNNCNEGVDEGVMETWHWDEDGDGYGLDSINTEACNRPTGYSNLAGDCDDDDGGVNPGATEECNAKDDDCDGTADNSVVCPCAIEYYPDTTHPYLFCMDDGTWFAAEAHCANYDYRLVTFDSSAELSWVTTTAQTYSDNEFWLGFTDQSTEGNWEWDDGSPVNYTNWCSGEPNNDHGHECVPQDEEDCAMLNWGSGGCWNDYPCYCDTMYHICEGASEYRPQDD